MDGERQSHHDIWVMDKTESGWSAPRHLPASVNSAADEFYPMALQNGTLYFGSQRKDPNGPGDIYRALPQPDGSYAVQDLGRPVNSAAGEYEAFVTEDERMLSLAVSGGPDSLGDFDLYVSHKQADGKMGGADQPRTRDQLRSARVIPQTDARRQILDLDELPLATAFLQAAGPDNSTGTPGAGCTRNGLGDIFQIDVCAVPALRRP